MIRSISWRGGLAVITETPMICTRRQARLALGESACTALDAASENPDIPWAMRDAIKSATEWHRDAPEIDELAWLLGLDGPQIDVLFARAMAI